MINKKDMLGEDNSTYDMNAIDGLLAPADKTSYGETPEERYSEPSPFNELIAEEGVQVAGPLSTIGRAVAKKLSPKRFGADKGVAEIKQKVEGTTGGPEMQPMGADESISPMASNINYGQIKSSDDVKFLIESMTQTNNAARRGTVPHEVTEAMAEDIDAIEMITGWKPGTSWNAEQLVAARQVMVGSATAVQKEAERIIAMGADASDAEWAEFARIQKVAATVAETVSGATAEAGRALSSMNIPVSGEVRGKAVQAILHGSGGKNLLKKKAELLAALKDMTPEEMARQTNNIIDAPDQSVLAEIWVNGKLSNPFTHAMNISANTMVQAFESFMVKPTAALVGSIRTMGKGGEKVTWDELQGEAFGIMSGFGDAMELFGQRMADNPDGSIFRGITKTELESWHAFTGKNILPKSAQGGGFESMLDFIGEYYVRLPGKFLEAEDNFFKTLTYRKDLNALSVRIAKSENLTGVAYDQRVRELVNNPTKQMNDSASNRAEYETFTNDPGEHGSLFGDLARSFSFMSARHSSLKYIIPFVRTPSNIIRYATENSILAPITKKWQSDFKAGGVRRDMALSRMAIGTTAFAAITQMYDMDILTGGGPTDPGTRSAMKTDLGWQPYSVKLNDGYYNITKADPMGMAIFTIASGMDRIKYAKSEEEASMVAVEITMAVAEAFQDKAFFQSFAELLSVAAEPTGATKKGARLGANIASGFVPAWLTLIAAATDENEEGEYVARSTYDFAESHEGIWGLVQNSFAARTPGFREDIPPLRTWKGEVATQQGTGFWDAHSFIKKTNAKNDPATRALLENWVAPQKPDSKQEFFLPEASMLKFGAKSIPMDLLNFDKSGGHVYSEFQAYIGRARASLIETFVESGGYKNIPETMKGNNSFAAQQLEALLAKGTQLGKMQFYRDYDKMAEEKGWRRITDDVIFDIIQREQGEMGKEFPVPEGPTNQTLPEF